MKKFVKLLTQKTLPALIAISITLVTLITTASGAGKFIQNWTSKSVTLPIEESLTNEKKEPIVSPIEESPKETKPITVQTPRQNLRPTSAPAVNSPTPLTAATSVDNRCIITLFGKQYDVTPLQSTHSGGNVFNCGTDMTIVYQQRHGTDLTMMQPYLITGTGNPASVTTGLSPTPVRTRHTEGDDD